MHILCLGASFTGRYLAANFPQIELSFFSRSSSDTNSGLHMIDIEQSYKVQYDVILDTVPAILDLDGKYKLPYADPVHRLQQAQPELAYIHISSTSVLPGARATAREIKYLPHLDESQDFEPDSERGRLRLGLEKNVQAEFSNVYILRAAGIYGPGRSLIDKYLDGDKNSMPACERVVSRIHVHDLCRMVIALSRAHKTRNFPAKIIHAVDTQPVQNSEIFKYLEEEYAFELPKCFHERLPAGRPIISVYRDQLIPNLRFPDYRSGLADCLARRSRIAQL